MLVDALVATCHTTRPDISKDSSLQELNETGPFSMQRGEDLPHVVIKINRGDMPTTIGDKILSSNNFCACLETDSGFARSPAVIIIIIIIIMLFFIEKGFEHFSFVTVSGISWLRWSVVDLTGRTHETYPRPVHVGVRRGKLAVGRIYPRVLVFSPVSIIPPML